MKTKSYHHGDLEKALIDAGLSKAKDSGARNIGVNLLAKEVDVSPMAIYRHFNSGEGLKACISQAAREELARRMLKAIAREVKVKERFQAMGRAYIRFALDEPGLFAVAFVSCEEEPKREDSPSAWQVFQDGILELCSAGLIAESELEQVSAFAWSTVHGYASLAGGTDPKRPKATEKIINQVLDRVWAGIIWR